MHERSTSDARQEPNNHRCIAGNRCRAKIVENGEPQPAYTEHADVLCDGCHAHYRDGVHRLLADYAMLRETLGDRHAQGGVAVAASPSPVVVINVTSDRLMTEIAEWSGYAADLASAELNVPRPDGGRKLAKVMLEDRRTGKLELSDPKPGSVAESTWEFTRPPESERLEAFVKHVEQNIDLIAATPPDEVQIWFQPRRCEEHSTEIASAKRILEYARSIKDPEEIADARDQLQRAFTHAGTCNECCGWSEDGRYQASQDVEMSGLDVLNKLTHLHRLTREHLGQTKLRHNYAMPCPRCGADVGRDAGSNVVTCDNDQCIKVAGKWSRSSWSEQEYQFLAGMMGDDVAAKFLLGEAYWWLDTLREGVTLIRKNKDLATDPKAAETILEFVDTVLAKHLTPKERKAAADQAAKAIRAADDWAWKREHPYTKPKKRPRKEPRADVPKIPASSLSTVVDTGDIPNPADKLMACREPGCNQVHAGECP